MNKDEIIAQLRDMAKHPTVTLPRDCEALKAAADLLAQLEQEYKRGYADAMNWKAQNHLEHLTAAQQSNEQVEPIPMIVKTAPERIWLDIGFDPSGEDEISFNELVDATWSQDNATGYGIEYVRADIYPPIPTAQPKEPEQEQEPKLIECGNCHEGLSDMDHVCPKCLGAGWVNNPVSQRTAAEGEDTRRAWVGLTDLENAKFVKTMERGNFLVAIYDIEKRLKEKNQ